VNSHLRTDRLHPEAQKGIQLFNQGAYYEAHDPLEKAWMETESPERDLYQGILQVGLAYFQITRCNYRGALKMFKRGQNNLSPLGKSLLGVNITQLQADARVVEGKLRDLGPERMEEMGIKRFPPFQ